MQFDILIPYIVLRIKTLKALSSHNTRQHWFLIANIFLMSTHCFRLAVHCCIQCCFAAITSLMCKYYLIALFKNTYQSSCQLCRRKQFLMYEISGLGIQGNTFYSVKDVPTQCCCSITYIVTTKLLIWHPWTTYNCFNCGEFMQRLKQSKRPPTQQFHILVNVSQCEQYLRCHKYGTVHHWSISIYNGTVSGPKWYLHAVTELALAVPVKKKKFSH